MNEASGLTALHRTAFSAAALRAAHTIRGGEPRIFRDELAMALADMTEAEVLSLAARVPPASASTCILRSRFAEDRLSLAKHRLNQYVVLGAGLDSYALRMGERLAELQVYEVDDPEFQTWKQRRINALGMSLPHQLHYVPCDFEAVMLPAALAKQGFLATEPCFISWLGVTQYLTTAAIRETLHWAAARPGGSELVLTFLDTNAQAAALKVSMAAAGVDVLSTFTSDEMTCLLREAGFSRIEHLRAAEVNERYFRSRSDGLMAPQIQCLVTAFV